MLDRALHHYLRAGGVIAYATESCFGLGCDPCSRLGVQRILRLKGRPQHKGLILIASKATQLRHYMAPLSADEYQQLGAKRPRPHTWLVPTAAHCPVWLSGRHTSIAVRITAFPPARQLCQASNMALVSTSANRSGHAPAKTTRQCKQLFGDRVRVIAGLTAGNKRPSTIQDLRSGRVLRA